ncbi:MAG: metal-dependent transcriptional regulator [Thermoplasmata archaeon]
MISQITKKERDCLIFIEEYKNGNFPIRLKDLALKMNIKPPSVLEILTRLEDKGLISKNRGMILLTDKGKEEYRNLIMVHRTIETLYFKCGFNADDACKKVTSFDYLIDPADAIKISALIGNPKKCPHGKPIETE